MKKQKLFLSIAMLFALVACGEQTPASSSSSESQSSVSESSLSESSVSESSSEAESSVSESSSEAPEVTLNLEGLKAGYRVRSGYSSKYTYSATAVPEYSFSTLYETTFASDAVKYVSYSGSDWESAKKGSTIVQYQVNEENKVVMVSVNTAGEVVETPTQFADPITAIADPDLSWAETGLKNAFEDLAVTDFTKQEDGTFALNVESVDEEVLSRLSKQAYLKKENNYSLGYDYFITNLLKSYVVTVNEVGNPVSFLAEYVATETDDGYGGVMYKNQAVQGTFEETGANLVARAVEFEKKYPELDATLSTLAEHNYYFQARDFYDDPWSGTGYKYILNGKAVGSKFEVSKTAFSWNGTESGTTTIGYEQADAEKYRKYEVVDGVATYTAAADSATAGTIASLLPNFTALSSALFVKDETTSSTNVNVYKFNLEATDLLPTTTMASIFNGFGISASPTYSAIVEFVVVVTSESVTFKNINGGYTCAYEFYKIGSAKLNTTVAEPPVEEETPAE